MSTAVLDTDKRVRLDKGDAPLEIQTSTGEVIGHYLPEAEYRRLIYALAEANCPISEEEWKERRKQKGGITIEEFWKKMGIAP